MLAIETLPIESYAFLPCEDDAGGHLQARPWVHPWLRLKAFYPLEHLLFEPPGGW